MFDAEMHGLLARWRAKQDERSRRALLDDIVRQPPAGICAAALQLLVDDPGLQPRDYTELGWLIRQLQCWTSDNTFIEQIGHRIISVTEPEGIRALLAIAYETDTAAGLAVLEQTAAERSLAGELRGFAIERIGWVGHASASTMQFLREWLHDPDPSLRFWSCYSLASLGDTSDLPSVEALLADQTEVVPFGTIAEQAAWTAEALRLKASSADMSSVDMAFELGESHVRAICARLAAKDPTLDIARDLKAGIAFRIDGVNRLRPEAPDQDFVRTNLLEFLYGLQTMLRDLRSTGHASLELPEWEPQAVVQSQGGIVVFQFADSFYSVSADELETEVQRFRRSVSAQLSAICPAFGDPRLVPGWIATMLTEPSD